MYLKRLEIAGFKSFAKKGELSFNVPISAIVGPNGSGKSNIAEAFRFVLGEQSIKSLRGKKGEDLIYNGGDAAARGNRASVAITFDNSSRFLDIDFDEVVVERIVYRDGVNEYLINGSVVRLKDVFELLSRAHIGPSGHHIISQGEADRILNANPRERKGMIEEALGLKMYQYKREESERKLEKTDENIKSVESYSGGKLAFAKACCKISAPRPAISGVHSDGLMTTALPAIKAGIASPMVRISGKFHGVIIPMTPRGW